MWRSRPLPSAITRRLLLPLAETYLKGADVAATKFLRKSANSEVGSLCHRGGTLVELLKKNGYSRRCSIG